VKITDALLGEHGAFYAQFDHLTQIVPNLTATEQVQQLGALLAAALKTHARLEDDLLFQALDPHLGPMGPLHVMRHEHDIIDGSLDRLETVEDTGEAAKLLLEVISVAREHFAKEEQGLYRMAQQCLGDEKLTELGAEWAKIRKVVV